MKTAIKTKYFEKYLWFSLSCKARPQGVQRLTDHRSRAGSQASAHKVNSCRLAVVRRRLVDHLSQKLKSSKLQKHMYNVMQDLL